MIGNRLAVIVVVFGACAGLSACATLSREQCQQGDWKGIGFSDGLNGYPASRIDDHAKACRDYGIVPDQTLYFAGRDQGLKRYCTPQNGWRVGITNAGYEGVCTGASAAPFLTAYHLGSEVGAARSAANDARDALERARDRADRISSDLDRAYRDLAKASPDQKDAVRQRIDRLRDERAGIAINAGLSSGDVYRLERQADDIYQADVAEFIRTFGMPPE